MQPVNPRDTRMCGTVPKVRSYFNKLCLRLLSWNLGKNTKQMHPQYRKNMENDNSFVLSVHKIWVPYMNLAIFELCAKIMGAIWPRIALKWGIWHLEITSMFSHVKPCFSTSGTGSYHWITWTELKKCQTLAPTLTHFPLSQTSHTSGIS